MDELEIDDGTDAAVEIAGLIERLKMAAYYLEGLTPDVDTLRKVDAALSVIDDGVTALENEAQDCFDAANANED